MNKRETRVINAFINCVKNKEYSYEYACVLIEDQQKYGWLTEEAKEEFYETFEKVEENENDEYIIEIPDEEVIEEEPNDEFESEAE